MNLCSIDSKEEVLTVLGSASSCSFERRLRSLVILYELDNCNANAISSPITSETIAAGRIMMGVAFLHLEHIATPIGIH